MADDIEADVTRRKVCHFQISAIALVEVFRITRHKTISRLIYLVPSEVETKWLSHPGKSTLYVPNKIPEHHDQYPQSTVRKEGPVHL